eukprot:scaffold195827_cov20-Tisochrysis_lutea.AAC.1
MLQRLEETGVQHAEAVHKVAEGLRQNQVGSAVPGAHGNAALNNVLSPSVGGVALYPSLQRNAVPVHAFGSAVPEATHGMSVPAVYPSCENLRSHAMLIPTDTFGLMNPANVKVTLPAPLKSK